MNLILAHSKKVQITTSQITMVKRIRLGNDLISCLTSGSRGRSPKGGIMRSISPNESHTPNDHRTMVQESHPILRGNVLEQSWVVCRGHLSLKKGFPKVIVPTDPQMMTGRNVPEKGETFFKFSLIPFGQISTMENYIHPSFHFFVSPFEQVITETSPIGAM